MTADRLIDDDLPSDGADEQLIAALAIYDESLDMKPAAAGYATAPFDPNLNDRFVRIRGVLDGLARLRDAETPRSAGNSAAGAFDALNATMAPQDDAASRTIGRFVILAELGRGGHGIVFRARDPALGREVALKVPRPELLLSDSARKRFLREGRSTASLAHPNLVTVFEAGEAGPVCYLAQEYCDGPNLESWTRSCSGPIRPRAAAALVAQLAEGIDHAHRRGVVHRDLKPGNVLMQPAPHLADMKHEACEPTTLAEVGELSSWTPRIVDFGLAQLDQGAGTLTATGALVGTPAYMAPEQLEAAHGDVGPACDIYALGGILFQVLTGQTLFRGASQTELIKQILLDPPRSPRRLRADVPADLEAICLRALEKKPADRYVTAGDMAGDLRRFLRGEPTLARPLTRAERLVRWARRKPWAAALVIVIAVSLVTMASMATAYTVWLQDALALSEQRRAEAETSRQAMRRQFYASDIQLAQDAFEAHRWGDAVALLEQQLPEAGDVDLREFCWGYLWSQTHQARLELRAGRGAVYCVEYSPDGKLLALGGEDGVLRIWDAATGHLRQELSEASSEVNALAFSPNGKQLVAVSDAGELIFWTVGKQFKLGSRVALSRAELWAVAFSPDGQCVATGGDDRVVRIVSVADGTVERELSGRHAGPVYAVAFWDGGRRLASGDRDGRLLDWDLSSDAPAEPRFWKANPGLAIRGLDFSPDEKHLALALREAVVLGVPAADLVHRLGKGGDDFSAVRFSPDGQQLVATNLDSTWWIGEWQGLRPSSRGIAGHMGRVYSAAYSPDGSEVATAAADGVVRQWSAATAGLPHQTTLARQDGADVHLSPNGQSLLIYRKLEGTWSIEAFAWDSGQWRQVGEWEFDQRKDLGQPVCSGDGRWIARCNYEDELCIWQVGKSQEWVKVGQVPDGTGTLRFAQPNNIILLANMEAFAAWDLQSMRQLWQVPIPRSDVRTLVSTKDLAICASGDGVDVVELKTGKRRFSVRRPGMEFTAAAVTADGSELFAAGSDRLIHRWSLPDGRPLEHWSGHAERIESLAVHPDGRTIVSQDAVGQLLFWHRETGRAIVTLRDRFPDSMAFTADGRYLHVAGQLSDKTSAAWTFTSSRLAHNASEAQPEPKTLP